MWRLAHHSRRLAGWAVEGLCRHFCSRERRIGGNQLKFGQNGREESEVNFRNLQILDVQFKIHLNQYIDMFLCVVFILCVRVCFLVFTASLLSWLTGAWLDWWAWPACFPLISPRPAYKTSRVLVFIVECEFNIFVKSHNYVAMHIMLFVLGSCSGSRYRVSQAIKWPIVQLALEQAIIIAYVRDAKWQLVCCRESLFESLHLGFYIEP